MEKMTKKREKLIAKSTCNTGFKESKRVEKLIPSREIRHCSACSEGFEKLTELVGHYQANPSHFPYQCGHCPKPERRKGGKEDVGNPEEQDTKAELTEMKFSCAKCTYRFKTHPSLVKHQIKFRHFDR